MEINLKDLDPGLGLQVVPRDPASPIGTHNVYAIEGADLSRHAGFNQMALGESISLRSQPWILFQDGNPAVNGINGCTMESLLIACAARLSAFQAHPLLVCPENQVALDYIKQAVYALNQRTTRLDHERELKA